MGSIITPICSNCNFPFKRIMVGGGMMNFLESIKVPFSCYECGTISVRNIYSPSIKCSKCRKNMEMFGDEVENINSIEKMNIVFEWRFGFGNEGYVLTDKNHQCPKCNQKSLKFESSGIWD